MVSTLQSRILKTEPAPWRSFQFIQQDNFKDFTPEAEQKLKTSLVKNAFVQPFHVWQDAAGALWCLDGRHRVLALEQIEKEGTQVPDLLHANFLDCANRQEAAKLTLVYSSAYARATQQGVADFLDYNNLNLSDFAGEIDLPNINLDALLDPSAGPVLGDTSGTDKASLLERFGVPPFSVLDARQGYWQERKNRWLAQGIASADGRAADLTFSDSARPPSFYELRNSMRELAGGVDPSWEEVNAEAAKRGMLSAAVSGTSIFDPVLCELMYRWFCPTGGSILDPFAGGSVRGMVASLLGYPYHGIDLRAEQVEANYAQAQAHASADCLPDWFCGDSRHMNQLPLLAPTYDFVFSCPPYADLEVYSDDPADLSTMDYQEFISAYAQIIELSVARLKPNRFACFVVGDVRDPKGFYRNFVGSTIQAFAATGAHLYNDAILLTQAGSLPIRISKQFQAGRKLGKTHQNVLVFYKGDPRQIRANYGDVAITVGEEKADICDDPSPT